MRLNARRYYTCQDQEKGRGEEQSQVAGQGRASWALRDLRRVHSLHERGSKVGGTQAEDGGYCAEEG